MILPHPNAPEGSVATLSSYSASVFPPTAGILCRNTAPLISFAFDLISRGVGVRVLGREIGAGLVSIITACKATSLDELEMALIRRRTSEAKTCRRNGNEQGACAVEDKYDCLNVFVQQARTKNHDIPRLCHSIEDLFDEKRRGLLTLSTIHKAKGLEWPTVFILDKEKYMPSKWATQVWEKRQEENLLYVARTRARLDLRYIKSGCWDADSGRGIEASGMPQAAIC